MGEKAVIEKVWDEDARSAMREQHRWWVRSIIIDIVVGALIGTGIALTIIYFDIANIGSLLMRSQRSYATAGLFIYGFAHLFAMTVCGSGIWFRATRQPDEKG